MHGYLIASIINEIIGPWAKVSNGRLYPLLKKMEAAGLVETTELQNPGGRQQKVLRITEKGIWRLRQLMLDTTSNPGEYQKYFFYKACFLECVTHTEALFLIEHYMNYCQTHLLHIRAQTTELTENAITQKYMSEGELKSTIGSLNHLKAQWELEFGWVESLKAQYGEERQGK